MDVRIASCWKDKLGQEFGQPYFGELVSYLKQAYRTSTIYPSAGHIFRAFDLTPFAKTKVVILGQDPYHGVGQADGLAFSVPAGVTFPPSLRNIFLERTSDLGLPFPTSGCLAHWAQQGVLLLNATLTVQSHQAASHQNKGWERFTDGVIQKIALTKKQVVFILWGNYAQKKGALIDQSNHLIIQAPHPSPLSAHRGFFGHRPFSSTNHYLKKTNQSSIQW